MTQKESAVSCTLAVLAGICFIGGLIILSK
jgi:hypothetical protein